MVQILTCSKENGDEILSVIFTTSFIIYIVLAVAMIFILGLIIFKRGNWAATVLTLAYTLAFCFKGLSFTSFLDGGNGTA